MPASRPEPESGERRNGDRANGKPGYVSDHDHFERILGERRRAHDYEHESHAEKHIAEQQLLDFARRTLEQAVADARHSVDERTLELVRRLDILESGGAPFASRLDDSLTALKNDVGDLKTKSIEQGALDALRQANTDAIERQRKQIRLVIITAAASLVVSLILVGIQFATT